MPKSKVTTIGDSKGAILPEEELAKPRVDKGDGIHVAQSPDGVHPRAHDAEFARQMDLAETVMRKHRDVLGKLAE